MKQRPGGRNRTGVMNKNGGVVGLDIGATAVRASVLTHRNDNGQPTVTMHASGEVALPPGVVVNGEVREPAALTLALKQLWSTHKIAGRHVVLGMANPQVLVRDLTVANLDPERRAKALPFQAKEVVALPIDEVVLDFCELGQPVPDAETVDGLLIATPREPVLRAVAAVEKANLKVARVDLSSFGVLRAIADQYLAVEAVIDLGAHLTTIVIHDHGVPKLVRTLARGGAQLTDNLAERMNMPAPEAEWVKCEFGLENTHPEIVRALVEGLRPLVAEIRTSVGYFRSARNDAPIERIALTGGGAHLRGIAAALADQIGLPTGLVNPLQHVRPASDDPNQSDTPYTPSAVSLGLAMGAAA